jgi:hypothetical protein
MTLKDLHTAVSFDLWFLPVFPDGFFAEAGLRGRLKVDATGKHTLVLYPQNGSPVLQSVKLRDPERSHDIDFHLSRNCAHLVEVIHVVPSTRDMPVEYVLVRVVFFAGTVVEMEEVCIGIDEKILDTAQKNTIKCSDINALCTLLQKICAVTVGNETYCIMLCGAAADADFAAEGDAAETAADMRAFALYGDRLVIPVERRLLTKERKAFVATKILFKKIQKGEGAFRLVHGTLRMVDFTKAGEESVIKTVAQATLNQLTEESGSFLSLWDAYGKTGGNMLLDRARQIGVLRVLKSEPASGGYKVFLDSEIPEKL